MCLFFSSISDSGEGRITHSKGGIRVARLLQALAEITVSETKEEGLLQLFNGLKLTYTTVTHSYDGEVTLKALIDAAAGHEPLLNRQVGAVIFCLEFTGVSSVTYRRGDHRNTLSLAPPKGGFLFCPVPTTLSKASLDCLAEGIKFPKGALMLGLAREHGVDLGADWLAKNPPDATWKGKSPTSRRILILSIHRY